MKKMGAWFLWAYRYNKIVISCVWRDDPTFNRRTRWTQCRSVYLEMVCGVWDTNSRPSRYMHDSPSRKNPRCHPSYECRFHTYLRQGTTAPAAILHTIASFICTLRDNSPRSHLSYDDMFYTYLRVGQQFQMPSCIRWHVLYVPPGRTTVPDAILHTTQGFIHLSQRKQRVKLGSARSSWTDLHKGVPKGSILGPLLLNIFIKDLFLSTPMTILFHIEPHVYLVCYPISSRNQDIESFNNNGMNSNPDKFHFMILSSSTLTPVELLLDTSTYIT